MQNFIINIGLNVGYIETKTQLDSTLYHIGIIFNNQATTILKDENNGGCWGIERTLIVQGTTELTEESFGNVIQNLCFLLHQEGMAYCLGDKCTLAYAVDYKGEQCLFEEQYFLRK